MRNLLKWEKLNFVCSNVISKLNRNAPGNKHLSREKCEFQLGTGKVNDPLPDIDPPSTLTCRLFIPGFHQWQLRPSTEIEISKNRFLRG